MQRFNVSGCQKTVSFERRLIRKCAAMVLYCTAEAIGERRYQNWNLILPTYLDTLMTSSPRVGESFSDAVMI